MRAAVLKFGTLSWELHSLVHQSQDKANGFQMEIMSLAGMTATRTALKSGAADLIVADWFWVNRQRGSGEQLQFFPFSSSVGSLVVRESSGIRSIEDLKGKRIGIAGGPLSKGWLLLQALGLRQGMDLKAETLQQYGAPPLLSASLQQGRLDALITFWHYAARLTAANQSTPAPESGGYVELINLQRVAEALGMPGDLPMLGYVFRQSWAEANPGLIGSIQRAVQQTRLNLQSDPETWTLIRPLMKAANTAEFESLKRGYLQGTPVDLTDAHIRGAGQMFGLLADLGGERLVGKRAQLDPETFWRSSSNE